MRRHKQFISLLSAVLLVSLQLHSLLHLFGSRHEAEGGAPCVACAESLSQATLGSADAPRPLPALAAYLVPASSISCLKPQFSGASLRLRGPPAIS